MSLGTAQPLAIHISICLYSNYLEAGLVQLSLAESQTQQNNGNDSLGAGGTQPASASLIQPQLAFLTFVFNSILVEPQLTQLSESGTIAGLVPPSASLVQITT